MDTSHLKRQIPGPPDPPLVPGHLGAPSYEDCARMLVVLSAYEALSVPMPAHLAWAIDLWKDRLRAWGKSETERGNFDRMMEAAGVQVR